MESASTPTDPKTSPRWRKRQENSQKIAPLGIWFDISGETLGDATAGTSGTTSASVGETLEGQEMEGGENEPELEASEVVMNSLREWIEIETIARNTLCYYSRSVFTRFEGESI